jgi:hypothetical protein
MVVGVRVANLLVFCGLLVAGYFLMDVAWWIRVLVGAAATVLLVIADIVTSRRRPRVSPSGTASE